MSARKIPEDKILSTGGLEAHKADNLTAICGPIF
jgi:hypothetical protein